jgi:zinc-ribbon domain
MRWFGRKRKVEDEEEVARCPRCGEPVPEGAVDCMMCGVALEPLRELSSEEEATSLQADRPVR